MKKTWRARIFSLTVFILMCQAVCSAPWPAAEKRLEVAATIFPLVDIIRNISGDTVKVIQILPAGASPHTFDLSPGKIKELQKARIIFKIGIIDDWIDSIVESAPAIEIISLRNHMTLKSFHSDNHQLGGSESHHHNRFDPHYWLDARNGVVMTQNICARLSALDPQHATLYAKNSQRYQRELLRLDDELKKACTVLKNNKIIVFHDGWNYFASAYGLKIIAVFQPAPGREPAPRDLEKLYALARKFKIKAVFSEPQLSTASLEPLLEDLELRLLILDPLGGAVPGDSYVRLLRRNVQSILRADAL